VYEANRRRVVVNRGTMGLDLRWVRADGEGEGDRDRWVKVGDEERVAVVDMAKHKL
jgi:hypothetical protein